MGWHVFSMYYVVCILCYLTLSCIIKLKQSNLSSYRDSPTSKNCIQRVLKASEFVVDTLLEIGCTIPIIKDFAEVLKKVFAVIKQASKNSEAIVSLHNHTVDIFKDLYDADIWRLSTNSQKFKEALDNLQKLLEDIQIYIEKNKKSIVPKVKNAISGKLIEKVDEYIEE